MRRVPAAVPLLLALLAAGCGSAASSAGRFTGAEQQVADTVERLQSAGESRDAKAICNDVLATALREQIQAAGSDCEQELKQAIDDADDFKLEVEDVTIQGNRATAKVRGRDRGAERVRTFAFVRERAGWRATSLGS